MNLVFYFIGEFMDMMRSIYAALRDIANDQLNGLMHDLMARTMARIAVTAHDAAVTAFVLSIQGREELRT